MSVTRTMEDATTTVSILLAVSTVLAMVATH